ncbi:MAG: hydrogenase 2 maturation endopeptidase [Syntrophus sp. PtaU1.Bin005]|jgi:Ni,Fe-hydrogenase maturation factor|nr:MAG: hydrogenase 2 maturation endopeptidase [Syntrophus sp. PtaB.Bin138]OPY80834.1 MAG: hydrogenase 2 maturation endopeptidase [Syntrophus sp. PtaU1.Bin005]
MTEKQEVTILGLDNILMNDDGFGVHFLREFERRRSLPDSVRTVEGGVMAYALLKKKFPVMEKFLVEELNRLSMAPVRIHA